MKIQVGLLRQIRVQEKKELRDSASGAAAHLVELVSFPSDISNMFEPDRKSVV